jgi:PhoD-like phosphatase, N-terminal domain
MKVARRMTRRARSALTRRQLLVHSASLVTLAGTSSLAKPYLSRAADRPQIAGGIQSGDVDGHRAIVWGRADRAARMRLECSTSDSFKTILCAAIGDAVPDRDFTAKLPLENLPDGQEIYYRLQFDDIASNLAGETRIGRFCSSVAQSTVAKYLVKRRGPPSQGWRTFLRNHAPEIAAMDLFLVPTIGFKLLYGFVIVRIDRRDLVWINVAANPTAEWIARQITEAFPWDGAPGYMISDRDGGSMAPS